MSSLARNAQGQLLPGRGSLNPSGRPKGLERRVRDLVGNDIDLIVKMLVEVTLGRGVNTGYHIRDRLKAAELLLDRGWGKARTTVDITTGEASPSMLDTRNMSDDELAEFERRLELHVIDVDSTPGRTLDLADALGDGE